MASDHQWGDKTANVRDHIIGHGYRARVVFRPVPLCTRCGVSKSAAEHFGWDCTPDTGGSHEE